MTNKNGNAQEHPFAQDISLKKEYGTLSTENCAACGEDALYAYGQVSPKHNVGWAWRLFLSFDEDTFSYTFYCPNCLEEGPLILPEKLRAQIIMLEWDIQRRKRAIEAWERWGQKDWPTSKDIAETSVEELNPF